MKRCSILAFDVLCSAHTSGKQRLYFAGLREKERKERDASYGRRTNHRARQGS